MPVVALAGPGVRLAAVCIRAGAASVAAFIVARCATPSHQFGLRRCAPPSLPIRAAVPARSD
jgi:hypothetical protein